MVASGQAIQKLRLVASAKGGTPTGTEAVLITEIRARLNRSRTFTGLDSRKEWFRYGVFPLVKYMLDVFVPDRVRGLDPGELGSMFYELLQAVCKRTKVLDLFIGDL